MIFNDDGTQFFPVAREAMIEEPVYPHTRGVIKCDGVFFRAELYGTDGRSLGVGQRVYMVGIRDNLVALIVP